MTDSKKGPVGIKDLWGNSNKGSIRGGHVPKDVLTQTTPRPMNRPEGGRASWNRPEEDLKTEITLKKDLW